MNKEPKTLQQAVVYFADAKNCLKYMASRRWPNGPVCPVCGSESVSFLENQNRWQCSKRHARRQFTIKTGTIFEDSPLGMDKWLVAMWLIVNCKNGISSYEIHRAIGVTQKTAWFMLHRIREAMQAGTFEKLSGEVESDETFIGGKAIYQHKWRREGKGRGSEGKTAVQGTIQRGGKVIATVVPNLRSYTIKSNVLANVEPGSVLYTDAFKSYWGLGRTYDHKVIDHMVSYVEGEVHTNSIENFWSCLKRTLGGTYISVEPYHLMRYVEEQTFRFNERKGTDSTRFNLAASQVAGKRLTYKKLTGKEDTLLLGTSLDS